MANSSKHQILASISLFTKDLSRAWILDSGATDHMTFSDKSFESYEKLAPGKNVRTTDGTLLHVVGFGSMKMQPIGTITKVFHVPNLFINLISVQRVASLRAYNILFDDIDAYLCHKEFGWKIGLADMRENAVVECTIYVSNKFILNSSNLIFKLEQWQVEVESTGRKVKRLKSETIFLVF